jgi:2-hydroxychromene-2-carboxylate isomerase
MTLEFWFEFASTYSYPAALRVEDAARARGVAVAWRAFLRRAGTTRPSISIP